MVVVVVVVVAAAFVVKATRIISISLNGISITFWAADEKGGRVPGELSIHLNWYAILFSCLNLVHVRAAFFAWPAPTWPGLNFIPYGASESGPVGGCDGQPSATHKQQLFAYQIQWWPTFLHFDQFLQPRFCVASLSVTVRYFRKQKILFLAGLCCLSVCLPRWPGPEILIFLR